MMHEGEQENDLEFDRPTFQMKYRFVFHINKNEVI
jgi:hypothetical protein